MRNVNDVETIVQLLNIAAKPDFTVHLDVDVDEFYEKVGEDKRHFGNKESVTRKKVVVKSNRRTDMVREARNEDLDALLNLYLFLHEDSIPELNAHLVKTWDQIVGDPNHHLIVNEIDGKIVSSCVCVIIPNLTRKVRPYAFVENVVTHADYRGNGYAGECLDFARKIAEQENCYKMMLLTGSKKPETLHFYEKAGYNSSDKTAFIQWIGMDEKADLGAWDEPGKGLKL